MQALDAEQKQEKAQDPDYLLIAEEHSAQAEVLNLANNEKAGQQKGQQHEGGVGGRLPRRELADLVLKKADGNGVENPRFPLSLEHQQQ